MEICWRSFQIIWILLFNFACDVLFGQNIPVTTDVETIFMGRCAAYKAGFVNPDADLEELRTKNCTELWELYSGAWVGKTPCSVTPSDYDAYIDAAALTITRNKANFWDGWDIYDTVRAYSQEGRRTWPLDYTLVGYLVNDLVFCGDPGSDDGIEKISCPPEASCGFGEGAVDGFWARASEHFAKTATGDIFVFFSSTREGGSFHPNNSYFTLYELANFDNKRITNVDIYIITLYGEETKETCETESIQLLKSSLDEKQISYTCHEQPRDIQHQICVDAVDDNDCIFLTDSGNSLTSRSFLFILGIPIMVWFSLL